MRSRSTIALSLTFEMEFHQNMSSLHHLAANSMYTEIQRLLCTLSLFGIGQVLCNSFKNSVLKPHKMCILKFNQLKVNLSLV